MSRSGRVLFGAFGLGALLAGGVAIRPSRGAAEAPAPDRSAGFTAIDPFTGERVALDFGAGPTHLAFFATWCRPCLEEVPDLFDLEDRWKPDGYRLFVVALPTRQTVERLRTFHDGGPLPGRLVFDADGSLAKTFEVATIPAHVLVDRHGSVVARAGALDDPFRQAVERLVRQEGRLRP